MTKTIDEIVVTGDLRGLTDEQRNTHYLQVCESLKLDFRLHPLEYIEVDAPNGGRKLVLYALRSATDQLRALNGISTKITEKGESDGVFSVTVEAIDKNGRLEMEIGAVSVHGKRGPDLANAQMAAVTKAKRRATLAICGTGLLDETEVADISSATVVAPGIGVAAPKIAAPIASSKPAEEVLPEKTIADLAATVTDPVVIKAAETVAKQETNQIMREMAATAPAVSPIADTAPKSPIADHGKRIKEYKQDHLRNGNMRPAKGLGIEAKFNKYVASRVGKQFASTLTAEEWTSVLDELDAIRAKDGDAGVVALIEQAIVTEVKV